MIIFKVPFIIIIAQARMGHPRALPTSAARPHMHVQG